MSDGCGRRPAKTAPAANLRGPCPVERIRIRGIFDGQQSICNRRRCTNAVAEKLTAVAAAEVTAMKLLVVEAVVLAVEAVVAAERYEVG